MTCHFFLFLYISVSYKSNILVKAEKIDKIDNAMGKRYHITKAEVAP